MTTTSTSAREALERIVAASDINAKGKGTFEACWSLAASYWREGKHGSLPRDMLESYMDCINEDARTALANLTPEPAEGEVTQADREAAAAYFKLVEHVDDWAGDHPFKSGQLDDTPLVQAFRKHRLASTPVAEPVGEGLREALANVDAVSHQSHRFRNNEMGWIIPDDEWQDLRDAILSSPVTDYLRKACEGITDDYMTSDAHHPGYVLIPTAKFDAILAALSKSPPSKGEAQ